MSRRAPTETQTWAAWFVAGEVERRAADCSVETAERIERILIADLAAQTREAMIRNGMIEENAETFGLRLTDYGRLIARAERHRRLRDELSCQIDAGLRKVERAQAARAKVEDDLRRAEGEIAEAVGK